MKKYGMAALAAALAICATAAPADDKYPTHPIRVIIPFSAGSATDIVPRMEVQAKLKKVGMEALAMTPAEFDARIREEIKANEKIIRNAGIKQN